MRSIRIICIELFCQLFTLLFLRLARKAWTQSIVFGGSYLCKYNHFFTTYFVLWSFESRTIFEIALWNIFFELYSFKNSWECRLTILFFLGVYNFHTFSDVAHGKSFLEVDSIQTEISFILCGNTFTIFWIDGIDGCFGCLLYQNFFICFKTGCLIAWFKRLAVGFLDGISLKDCL